MDLNQFILALRARRKAFFIAFAATVFTAIAVALIVPKKYVATATLMADARDEQSRHRHARPQARQGRGQMTLPVRFMSPYQA